MTTLAIDQGTTSTRAFLVGPDGRPRLIHSHSHRQHYPRPGWVEHDPEELIAALTACLDAAATAPGLAAVGLDNQGESCLAWNAETLRAISPVIVWQDDRTLPDCTRLRDSGAETLTLARAGLPLDPYFSASKLAWILQNTPEAARLAAKGRLCLGTTDAFFRHRLTGRFETDVTTASRTSLMALATCAWDADLCALFGVPVHCLPRITPSSGDLGSLRIGARHVPLTASLVDQQAATYGHGCRSAGEAKITFGTGAFALMLTGPAIAGHTPCLPTVAWAQGSAPATYALDGGVYAAGSAVNWAQGLGLFSDLASLNRFDTPCAHSRGLVFVPALAGLACPHWDRHAKGAWLGLGLNTTPRDMMQALLEGIAFRMAEVLTAMTAAHPLTGPLSIDGGLSANPWFCQTLANLTGQTLRISQEAELTALGTAALAAGATGAAPFPLPPGRRVTPAPPDPAAQNMFRAAREAIQTFGQTTGRKNSIKFN